MNTICRVFGRDVDQSNYCYVCGWLNGEAALQTPTVKIIRGHSSAGFLTIENQRPARVSVSASLKEAEGVIFAPGAGVLNDKEKKITVPGGGRVEIPLILNTDHYNSADSFKIDFTSDDDAPVFQNKDNPVGRRPYTVKQMRSWYSYIHIEVTEPSRLDFDKHFIIFSN